jgi:hypothetical protein
MELRYWVRSGRQSGRRVGLHGDTQLDRGALTGRGLDQQVRAKRSRARAGRRKAIILAHADDSIIEDAEENPPLVGTERDPDTPSAGFSRRLGEDVPHDGQHAVSERWGDRWPDLVEDLQIRFD